MITKVKATGFKGQSFDQPLGKLTLFIGPNGAGKSARSDAIQLAVNGYIPGKDKRNQGILDAYGNGKMLLGIQIGKVDIAREFIRSSKGTVSQKYLVSGRKSSKEDFIAAMARAGKPVVLDIPAFMELSDQKKADFIFDIFPPGDDLAEVSDELDNKIEKLNSLRQKLNTAEKTISKLSASKASIEMPSGTLAETTGQIGQFTLELADTEKQLAEVKEAEIKRKADEEAKIKAREEAEAKRITEEKAANQKASTDEKPFFPDIEEKKPETTALDKTGQDFQPEPIVYHSEHDAFESILKIITTIEEVNCPICSNGAALMVARKEIRKFQVQETS